jgi:hypothetical protein
LQGTSLANHNTGPAAAASPSTITPPPSKPPRSDGRKKKAMPATPEGGAVPLLLRAGSITSLSSTDSKSKRRLPTVPKVSRIHAPHPASSCALHSHTPLGRTGCRAGRFPCRAHRLSTGRPPPPPSDRTPPQAKRGPLLPLPGFTPASALAGLCLEGTDSHTEQPSR